MRRELREWRGRGGGGGLKYIEKKKEYKELCGRKKKEDNKRWEKQALEAKRKSEAWELINRERKRRNRVIEGIGMEEWKEHFMRLLGRVEGKLIRKREREREEEETKEGISRE